MRHLPQVATQEFVFQVNFRLPSELVDVQWLVLPVSGNPDSVAADMRNPLRRSEIEQDACGAWPNVEVTR